MKQRSSDVSASINDVSTTCLNDVSATHQQRVSTDVYPRRSLSLSLSLYITRQPRLLDPPGTTSNEAQPPTRHHHHP